MNDRILLKSLALVATLFLGGCASTGDPGEDTIFFNTRMADQRLAVKERQLAVSNADAIAARRRNLQTQGQVNQTKRGNAELRAEIAEVKRRKAAKEAELQRVLNALSAISGEEGEAVRLRERRNSLQDEVNRLDTRLADLQELESKRYPR